MSAKEDFLAAIFDEIDKDSKVVRIEEFAADDNFSIEVRTKLQNENDDAWTVTCNKWVEKFSNQTNSRWVSKTSLANAQRIVFRKVYRCKDKACKSKIDIKVKKITKDTIKNDKLLLSGLNAVVKIIFQHEHDR